MADTVFNIEQIIGKTLWAQTRVNVRALPGTTATILRTANAGDQVGTVFSYVTKDNKIWWQLEGGRGWVQHNAGWYSIKQLKSEGAKTVAEQEKEKKEADKGLTDKLSDFFSPTGAAIKYGLPILLIVGGFLIVDRLLPSKKTT